MDLTILALQMLPVDVTAQRCAFNIPYSFGPPSST